MDSSPDARLRWLLLLSLWLLLFLLIRFVAAVAVELTLWLLLFVVSAVIVVVGNIARKGWFRHSD